MLCEKCGGKIDENMTFCDKCGAEIEKMPEPESVDETTIESGATTVTEEIYETHDITWDTGEPGESDEALGIKDKILNFADSVVPKRFLTKGDRTLRLIGAGCALVTALLYVLNFLLFMDDICYPIGMGTEALGVNLGASRVWMIIYWLLTLTPVVVAFMAIRRKKHPVWMAAVAFGYAFITLFTFVWWLCFEPSNLMMALSHFDGMNKFAWYVLVDCLSEFWYLKLIFIAGCVAGFGADYHINRDN